MTQEADKVTHEKVALAMELSRPKTDEEIAWGWAKRFIHGMMIPSFKTRLIASTTLPGDYNQRGINP